MPFTLKHLTAVPFTLVIVGGVAYLWAVRRRSPRASGLGIGGLVGVLLHRTYEEFGYRPALQWVLEAVGPDQTHVLYASLGMTALSHLFQAACVLLVAVAITMDRRPPGEH